MLSRQSVAAGACFLESGGEYCALSPVDCKVNETFESSSRLINTARAHGGRCLESKFVKSLTIGTCRDQDYCASTPDNCASPSTFSATSDTCVLSESLYGKCDDMCVWSTTDCPDLNLWDPHSKNCSCDQVRVGGCLLDSVVYCAIGPEACDPAATWIAAVDLPSEANTECYLCRQESVLPPKIASQQDPSESDTRAIIAGTIAGALVVCVAVLGVFWRKGRLQSDKEDLVTEPPPEVELTSTSRDGEILDVIDVEELSLDG